MMCKECNGSLSLICIDLFEKGDTVHYNDHIAQIKWQYNYLHISVNQHILIYWLIVDNTVMPYEVRSHKSPYLQQNRFVLHARIL